MTDRDIVDDIDRLVDEQMRQERSGYDHSINQTECPHAWCDADFHGLPIKQRMQQMRNGDGSVDPEYRYNEDDSPVICPGSLFDGEFTPPASSQPNSWITAANPTWLERHGWVRDNTAPHGWRYSGEPELQFPRLQPWQINPDAVRVELHTRAPEPEPVVPFPVGGAYTRAGDGGWQALGTLVANSIQFTPDTDAADIEAWVSRTIRTDIQRTMSASFTIRDVNPATVAMFQGRSPIIDMDTVHELRRLFVTAPLTLDASDDAIEWMDREIVERAIYAAGQRFPGVAIDPQDVQIEHRPAPERHCTMFEGRWRPATNEVELHGGPSHGRAFTVDGIDRLDVVRTVPPVTFTAADFDSSNTVADIPAPLEYRRAGWNTETRRWVYRNDSDWRPTCSYCRRQSVRDLVDKCCQDCLRNLVITADHREGEMYVRRNGMRRAIVVSRDHHVRGIDLEMFRVHVLSWPRDETGPYLRHRAALARRPLESFCVNTSGEQAA